MNAATAAGVAARPQTLAQKLIARACGRAAVAVGEIVTCKVDLAMFHDSSGPRRLAPMLEALGVTTARRLPSLPDVPRSPRPCRATSRAPGSASSVRRGCRPR